MCLLDLDHGYESKSIGHKLLDERNQGFNQHVDSVGVFCCHSGIIVLKKGGKKGIVLCEGFGSLWPYSLGIKLLIF